MTSPVQSEVMTMTAATAPVYGRYRKAGAQIVPTHPPAVDPLTLVPRDGDRLHRPAAQFQATGGSAATLTTNYGGNSTPAWQLLTGQEITTQGVEIPDWWETFKVVALISKPTAAIGNASLSLQRQYTFAGEDVSGGINRVNSVFQGVDMGLAGAYVLREVLLEPNVVVPDRRPDLALSSPWWRFRVTRIATSDTYGAASVGFHGLAVVRTG